MMVNAAGVFTFVSVNTDSTIQVRKVIDEDAEIPVENLPVWHDIAGSGYARARSYANSRWVWMGIQTGSEGGPLVGLQL